MSNKLSPVFNYIQILKEFEQNVSDEELLEGISAYIKFVQKTAPKTDFEIEINGLKSLSSQLFHRFVNVCMSDDLAEFYKKFIIPNQKKEKENLLNIPYQKTFTVEEVAKHIHLTPTQVRNIIKKQNSPLKAQNLGERKTTIYWDDFVKYYNYKNSKVKKK